MSELTYHQAHNRVHILWGSAAQYVCIECGRPAQQWAYDGTDPAELSGDDWNTARRTDALRLRYSVWPEFYMPMCRSCHKHRDLADLTRPFKRGWVGNQKDRHRPMPRTEAEWDAYLAS